ncbi:MAG: hypothetical protein HOO06_11715 [Bdellovibrionaceae bacterium]|jgi:hypothetical protein|nr:hypothetical protein [Pseudobdellovibrionaceae bacterium]
MKVLSILLLIALTISSCRSNNETDSITIDPSNNTLKLAREMNVDLGDVLVGLTVGSNEIFRHC